tara:strand:+ start:90 stop:281 length:192 start_codon:yes stop_codon:yes gene_type:complete
MLSSIQIERVLKHCEKIDARYGDAVPTRLQSEWYHNKGWMEALRFVLETDTQSIRNTPYKEKE